MATLQSGKCFTVPTFFGMCCRSEWQERMYIYKWHEVDQTKHEIFCVHIVCNEIQVKVNLEITTFFFYLRFPYCPNFFWFGVVNQQTGWIPLSVSRWRLWKSSDMIRVIRAVEGKNAVELLSSQFPSEIYSNKPPPQYLYFSSYSEDNSEFALPVQYFLCSRLFILVLACKR